MKPIIFSGIQPSAESPHLGNYLGALRQWVNLQRKSHCYYCLVDLHALTVLPEKKKLNESIYTSYAVLLALGINPNVSNLFVQSQVPEHSELTWLMSCHTSVGQLSRMTQYKDKSKTQKSIVSAGLYTYPTLMAADVLLYDTDQVPVGEDQLQHLELARDLAKRFNHLYGTVFKLPKPLILKETSRIMALQEPDKKMSKSDTNINNTIFLLDSPDIIRKKIASAVTDSETEIKFDIARSGIYNLMNIYRALKPQSEAEIEASFRGKNYKQLKSELAERIIGLFKPIQLRYRNFINDRGELEKIMKEQSVKVREVAAKKISAIKKKIGLVV
jgi:tryptophanyl-tRNA synthetase